MKIIQRVEEKKKRTFIIKQTSKHLQDAFFQELQGVLERKYSKSEIRKKERRIILGNTNTRYVCVEVIFETAVTKIVIRGHRKEGVLPPLSKDIFHVADFVEKFITTFDFSLLIDE